MGRTDGREREKGRRSLFEGAFRGKQMGRADCGKALTVNKSDLNILKYYSFRQRAFLMNLNMATYSLPSPPVLISRQTYKWHCRNVQNAAGVVNGGFCSHTPPPDSGVIVAD